MTIAGASPYPTAYVALVAAASRDPSKTAIHFEGEDTSFSKLLTAIDNTAGRLGVLGVGRGSAFAVYSQNRPDILLCYFAAAKLGAVFVPLNPNLTASEVGYAVHHSGAAVLFHDEAGTGSAEQSTVSARLLRIEALREPATSGASGAVIEVEPESDFLIIYTSGSTGVPKAIVLDHVAQVNAALALSQMWGVGAQDVTVVGLPLGYLYGLSTAAAAGLQSGGSVVILRRFHPRDVLEALVAHRATVYHGVPTMYSMMLDYCEQRDLSFDLSGVRELICAGAPLPDEMRQRFARRFNRELQDYYAMTECTPVFGKFSDDPRPIPPRAIGRLAPGASVRILRPDGTDCADGEEGEMLVRGAATMKRYLKSPELTQAAMQDGLVRSGDLGYRDSAGYYYISGRIKDVIIRGGANISPAEVEAVLSSHAGVQEAAVVGAPDRIFGEVPIAFIVRRHESQVSSEDLIAYAEKSLSDFKVPRRFVFATELPQGKTGKVDKAALKRRLAEDESGGNAKTS